MDIGLLTAFVGGILALLSPCGALLLPAFFASTVGSGPRLWVHGAVFYGGLLLVLVPLGVGAGAIGVLFAMQRGAIVLGASLLLIALGLVQMLGFGFDPARLLPGTRSLQGHAHVRSGLIKTLLLGAASGVAGFCAGPVLGAVLTLAAAQGDLLSASILLGIYGAGMVVPLLLIATLWGRLGTRGRSLLRGRAFTVPGRELHTTSVLTGALIVAVGVLFWSTNGLVGMPELLPTSTQAWLQEGSALLANPAFDVVVILVTAGIALFVWVRMRQRRGERDTQLLDTENADEPDRP